MTLRKAILAATMLTLPWMAEAQPVTGLYLGAGVGANWRVGDVDGENPGWVALGSVGWGFGNGLRAEIEGNYRFNEVKGNPYGFAIGPSVATVLSSGDARTYGGMVNLLYDFAVPGFPVIPYIGGGVGAGWSDFGGNRLRVVSPAAAGVPAATRVFRADDRSVQFAYQAIAGAALPLTAVLPGLAMTLEYRYYATLDADIGVKQVSGPLLPGCCGSVSVDNKNHSLLLGVRYNFGVAPPPVVAVAPQPPAPPRTFLVFFDWDRADLTDRARQIIGEAAEASRRVQTTRIEVAGHADRSGDAAYNQRLSQRRADNVAAELVRRGVARNIITIQAFGESRPLVPTADGVREPQNRRVEIVLR
jgi:opacity protein-like surface antigen